MPSDSLMIFSSAAFVSFLKSKNDTVSTTKKLIADSLLCGRISSEFKSNDSQKLLCENSIRHETSVPNSTNQNGIAKWNRWTLFKMDRYMMIETKTFWIYAVVISAVWDLKTRVFLSQFAAPNSFRHTRSLVSLSCQKLDWLFSPFRSFYNLYSL